MRREIHDFCNVYGRYGNMVSTQGNHDPSRYRALVREVKGGRGRRPGKLLDEARRLKDPYYASLALFEISADPGLGLKKAAHAAREALVTAGRVERLWRRAELLTIIARKVNAWRDERAARSREKLLDGVLDAVTSMPEGQGLSAAIKGCAPRLGRSRLGPLLVRAASNRGFEATDVRAVIRQWAQQFEGEGEGDGEGARESERVSKRVREGPTLEDILDALTGVEDLLVRSRLMGYLHLVCRRSKCATTPHPLTPLLAAVEAAVGARKEERLDALRYLAKQAFSSEEQEVVAGALDGLDDPADKTGLMAAIGASADRAGLKEMALNWFREGLRVCTGVEDPHHRARIRLNLARGIGRCGNIGLAKETCQAALDDCGDNEKLAGRIRRSMEGLGFEPPRAHKAGARDWQRRGTFENAKAGLVEGTNSTNNVLALYNTYKGGLKPVHLRAVARAAPLCAAFGLDLALMDFPTDDLKGLLGQVVTETNVGRGGRYLKELEEQGRILLVSNTRYGPPGDFKELGLPVATTSHPKEDKKVGMAEAVQLARSRHPLRRMCLIMGLGKKGLPPPLLDRVPYHLELTGSNVPLETCTAMGVIAQQMRSVE